MYSGDCLVIALDLNATLGEQVSVQVVYEAEGVMAMSWLNANQTSGGQLPYAYSQCEDVNCRTIVPVQDTPSNKVTYSARVQAMKELSVKMSANETLVQPADPDNNEAYFWCEIPIPNYLMAIAVGHLEYRSLGRNVGVITEPEQMDKCFNELTDMQVWLDTIENYLTPYIWGNYTILILPPSFPMGGMENPLLTFASPTIIVGDKSQVYVATHEMAHSWTGNTVTCQNWEDFWLNEGFTVFVERHVSGILYGNDFALVEAQLGNTSLWNAMVDYDLLSSYSSIHPVLKGDNPDHSFSEVPYEKGFQLLWYMQNLLGNETMQEFLQYYINENFEKSITALDLERTWQNFVGENAGKQYVNNVLSKIEWSTWKYLSELPDPSLGIDFFTVEANES